MAASRRRGTRRAAGTPKRFCTIAEMPPRDFSSDVAPGRVRAIVRTDRKWVNGSVLRYHFFRSPSRWTTSESKKNVVRAAFKNWKNLGIGLDFKEVDAPQEAEIRIGFQSRDGHWSYVGRDVLGQGVDERTLNLDKSDAWTIDTAMHEIGHTLGLPHEHQNPHAGIVWDEEAVYAALGAAPNFWDRRTTFHNIIRKIDADDVQGSSWDPDSIMHYPFEAGLIRAPTRYQRGLDPAPGLSARDKEWILKFYPPLTPADHPRLRPFEPERLHLDAGEQANYLIKPEATRKYNIQTFGQSDSVMVLFERVNGELRYRSGDDDSGEAYNAHIVERLYAGREYVVRLRLYWQNRTGDLALMLW